MLEMLNVPREITFAQHEFGDAQIFLGEVDAQQMSPPDGAI